jgi:hypothetical protein
VTFLADGDEFKGQRQGLSPRSLRRTEIKSTDFTGIFYCQKSQSYFVFYLL